MMFDEAELVPISALQHMLYCPRQCALIHIERQWDENRDTAEGQVLHAHADVSGADTRNGISIHRHVPLCSRRVGIFGIADVVEMRDGGSQAYPVEYKRGRPKTHRADEVQLCAQALCLEEMLGDAVREGALFYGGHRRRWEVYFDSELRALTERIAADTRRMLEAGVTPSPEYAPRKCNSCSLKQACRPDDRRMPGRVDRWLAKSIRA